MQLCSHVAGWLEQLQYYYWIKWAVTASVRLQQGSNSSDSGEMYLCTKVGIWYTMELEVKICSTHLDHANTNVFWKKTSTCRDESGWTAGGDEIGWTAGGGETSWMAGGDDSCWTAGGDDSDWTAGEDESGWMADKMSLLSAWSCFSLFLILLFLVLFLFATFLASWNTINKCGIHTNSTALQYTMINVNTI